MLCSTKMKHMLMICNIYYEGWQIQCCGEPFKIGERVHWTGESYDYDIKDFHINFNEDHHAHQSLNIEGTVTRIVAVTSEEEPNKRSYSFEEVNLLFEDIQEADGYESEKEDTDKIHFIFWGYIVTLQNVEVTTI